MLVNKAVNAKARATFCDGEEPACERKQDAQREREREREIGTRYISIFKKCNSYKLTTTLQRLQSHFI